MFDRCLIRFGCAQIYSPMGAKSRFRSQNEDTSSCNCPRKPFAVTRRSRRMLFSECVPHARAGFVQSTRLHLAQASCRHRFLAFWLSFTVVTQNVRRALAQSVALSTHRMFQRTSSFAAPLRGSVCACSHEPGAGLRRPLMCCADSTDVVGRP